jgi:hypothetical protein
MLIYIYIYKYLHFYYVSRKIQIVPVHAFFLTLVS